MTDRRPLRRGSSPIVFRYADDPGTELRIYGGAEDYDEFASKWRAGYRTITRSGTFLRDSHRAETRPRDYLADHLL